MANNEKSAILSALIQGILYDLMVKTNVYNVMVDDTTTLADKLYEVIVSLNKKITPEQLKKALDEIGEGPQGPQGDPGVGIQSIVRTSGNGEEGSTDIYTITLTDGSQSTFQVYNGSDGPQGPAGEDGKDGRGIVSITRTAGTGAAGTTDTYTITYTDNTTSSFTVYNGADGVSGGNAEYYPDWSHLKWYVMGDSLTSKDNAFTDKRYYDFVQEKTGIQIIVDGIGGTGYGAGVSNGQSFLDRVKNIPADVDVVTIFGSGNDILYLEVANVPIYDALSWLCLNRPGLRVVVVPPSPWKDYNKREDPWKAYCDRLQVSALACDFRYLSDMWECPPFNPNFAGHMETFFTTDSSGIHPNELGHEMLAQYFYNALCQELALKV